MERHPIKTFVSTWNDGLIQEASRRNRGGQVYLFGEAPKIDHMRLVKLIQTRPKEYRLDQASGALKFFRKMDEPAKRVAQVETVVGLLTG